MLNTPANALKDSSNPVKNLVHNILSYNSNIMLAAIILLLLVILFVLLLHVYAKWFLLQARQRSRRSVSVPQVMGARSHHFHSFTIDTPFATTTSPIKKGLESSVISSIPLFMFESDEHKNGGIIECAICLSVFEDREMGRKLPICSHAFHVDCIDMWLHSHSTCPICRCPVLFVGDEVVDREMSEPTLGEVEMRDNQTSRLEIVVEVPNYENDENGGTNDIVSACSSSSSLPSRASLYAGDSVKIIMGRNRSERKVHPSTDFHEPDV